MSNYRKVTTLRGTSFTVGETLPKNDIGIPKVVEISLLGAEYHPDYWVVGVYVNYEEGGANYPAITIPYHATELLFILGE